VPGDCFVPACVDDPSDGPHVILEGVAPGTACDDGDACTTDDICAAGACVGEPVVCEAPEDPCLVATCDPETGLCATDAAPDGTPCDDLNPGSRGDACRAGVCVGVCTCGAAS